MTSSANKSTAKPAGPSSKEPDAPAKPFHLTQAEIDALREESKRAAERIAEFLRQKSISAKR